MKKVLLVVLLGSVLTACGFSPVKPDKIVYVDRAVPLCPAPPKVPTAEYQTDKLTPADVNNPGKVGVAYKYDMLLLRKQIKIYQMILDEYEKTNQNFDQVIKELNQLQGKTQTP